MRISLKRYSFAASLWVALSLALTACAGSLAAPTATLSPATVTPAATATTAVSATTAPATLAPATLVPIAASQPILATSAKFDFPVDIAIDADDNLYISECALNQIYKVDRSGLLTVFAGAGGDIGYSGDGGPAVEAQFSCPAGMAFDRDGNAYISDLRNYVIRRVDRNGIISTVIGNGLEGYGGDGGPARSAALGWCFDIGFDAAGNLYIADASNFRVRRVGLDGIITTIAGDGTQGYAGDGGPALAAQFDTAAMVGTSPTMGIAVAADGTVYISDTGNASVRRIDPQSIITAVAGTGQPGYSGDGGPATSAQIARPVDLALDAAGNIYISENPVGDVESHRVRRVDTNGIITTIAGSGTPGPVVDGGPAATADLNYPRGLAFDREGNLYIADRDHDVIRKIDQNGIITTVAGGGY